MACRKREKSCLTALERQGVTILFLLLVPLILISSCLKGTDTALVEPTRQLAGTIVDLPTSGLQPTLSPMEVHFLDVGQGDATVIICGGQAMMIDGGPAMQSDLVYSYLKETLQLEHIDWLIASHHDGDHTGGLSAALHACSVGNIAYPPISAAEEAEDVTGNFATHVEEYVVEHPTRVMTPEAQQSFALGSATVTFVSCGDGTENSNNGSIVVRVDHGANSFLFTGDVQAEKERELSAFQAIDVDVLKVAHHGSESSSEAAFVQAVSPRYAIISVGRDNVHGFPAQEVLACLKEAGAAIYRTDCHGTILCKSDGSRLTFETQRDDPLPTKATEAVSQVFSSPTVIAYVGNARSYVFHVPDCSSVQAMSEKNKVTLYSLEEAAIKGYSPCKRCNPR